MPVDAYTSHDPTGTRTSETLQFRGGHANSSNSRPATTCTCSTCRHCRLNVADPAWAVGPEQAPECQSQQKHLQVQRAHQAWGGRKAGRAQPLSPELPRRVSEDLSKDRTRTDSPRFPKSLCPRLPLVPAHNPLRPLPLTCKEYCQTDHRRQTSTSRLCGSRRQASLSLPISGR